MRQMAQRLVVIYAPLSDQGQTVNKSGPTLAAIA
jgi:hypothetical protein